MVAIHNRALTLAQIQQNYAAGVGQKYFLLFNVADLTGVPQGYVMMTVSLNDSFSYLFTNPTFSAWIPPEARWHTRHRHAHRRQRHRGAGGTELHPAEYDHHRGQLQQRDRANCCRTWVR